MGKLGFIAETGVTTNRIRRYGRAPKGKRLVDKTPQGPREDHPLRCRSPAGGVTALAPRDEAMNGERFVAWSMQIVAPPLTPGDIVIWDNLAAHKTTAARTALEAAGAIGRPVPAYSPDLNPIEKAFATRKALLGKAKPRTPKAIDRQIAKIFTALTPPEGITYFKSCGYSN